MWGYVIDTGALTLETPLCWGNEACFLKVEGAFGANSYIQSIIGKLETTAYFVGDVTPAMQARIDAWDQAPGITCTFRDCLANGQRIGDAMPSDAVSASFPFNPFVLGSFLLRGVALVAVGANVIFSSAGAAAPVWFAPRAGAVGSSPRPH